MRMLLHIGGFKQLRRDPAVYADLNRRGKAIADRAGEGFEAHDNQNQSANRARVFVVAKSKEARKREARDRVLVKSLDAGRS